MNKQYLAFLQSRRSRACERKTDLPFTDKMVCVLVAYDPREARIKLKKLVHATCREKNHFLGADCINLVNLIELKESNHSKLNDNLGVAGDPATKALLEFVDALPRS
jgi:hypothetical protein